jgi:hypothetical protein
MKDSEKERDSISRVNLLSESNLFRCCESVSFLSACRSSLSGAAAGVGGADGIGGGAVADNDLAREVQD